MKTVVLVSRCLRKHDNYYELHFRGCLEGEVIKLIHLRTSKKLFIGSDYIIWLGVEMIRNGVLWGKAQKIRCLDDLKIDL